MKKRLILSIVFLFIIISVLPIVNASISLGNLSGSIETTYAPSENIRGWINFSVKNEFYDILVKGNSNLKGEIKLIDLLRTNSLFEGDDYFCTTTSCSPYYKAKEGETSKTFSLKTGEEKVLAFNIQGNNIVSISSLTFDINVNNNPSCVNPLEVYFLPDIKSEVNWMSYNFSQIETCLNNNKYGCFDKNALSIVDVPLTNTTYCEKVRLTPSKYYNLGAYVKNNTLFDDKIRMSLHDYLTGTEIGKCNLDFSKKAGESEYYCNIQTELNKEELLSYNYVDYYVCIKQTGGSGAYSIKSESSGNTCGFFEDIGEGTPENPSYDYSIFAESYKFDNIGKINFNEEEYEMQGNEDTMEGELNSYFQGIYNKNCTEGCAFPIKFKALFDMDITIDNIVLKYSTGQAPNTSNTIYEVETTKPKISFDFLKVNLDESNLSVLSKPGNYSIRIFVGDEEIKKESIKVLNVPIIKNLYPTIVSAGVPTIFVLDVETQKNKSIINYTWNFGDGTIKSTKTNKITYSYQGIKLYNLKVRVTDSEGLSSEKTFAISVGSPKETIGKTLQTYTKRIQNLSLQISSFPSPYRPLIRKVLNIENVTSQLQELQRQYNSLEGDNKIYLQIMNQLASLNVPYKIETTSKGDLPYYIDYKKINLNSLKEAGAGDYSAEKSEDLKKAIAGMQQESFSMNINYEYVSAYYDSGTSQLMGIFKLKLSPKGEIKGSEKENYLIFSDAIKSTNFDFSSSSYNPRQLGNDVAIKFAKVEEKEIIFYYKGEKRYETLDIYPSLKFSELGIDMVLAPCNYNERCEKGETWKNCRADCKPWKIAWVLWLILLFSAFIVYLLLSQWYRVHYESKLFKNRHDIYNLLVFMETAVHQGLTYNTIRQRLKEMSWTNEQISYVINKYQGKSVVPLDISKILKRKIKPSKESAKIKEPSQNK